MNTVQLVRAGVRRVGVVEGTRIRLIDEDFAGTLYDLALAAIRQGRGLVGLLEESLSTETLDYEAIYAGESDWRLLPSFDHPQDPAHCLVSGTGLTHKASAENRAVMHQSPVQQITDSMRMYQMGLEGGRRPPGEIGVQPEWFYKGSGSVLRAHGEKLVVPAYAWDGGEEPEIAGVYVIGPEGEPFRVGLTMGNEFSDHLMEKQNYLYLAPSKLRNCSIGPELVTGRTPFEHVPGKVCIVRRGAVLWEKDIWTGEQNMSHSVSNLEHHHFKYESHRRPGDVHIHFVGADAFSFGDGLRLEEGDVMEVSFSGFGRPLRNRIQMARKPEVLITIKEL